MQNESDILDWIIKLGWAVLVIPLKLLWTKADRAVPREEIDSRFRDMKNNVDGDIAKCHAALREDIGTLRTEIRDSRTEIISILRDKR